MRIGLLADVHGNEHALGAVLERLGSAGVDRYVFAGDAVGYGPSPSACVGLLAGLDPVRVAGNHDLMVLGRLSEEHAPAMVADSSAWTRAQLDDGARGWLAGLPEHDRAGGGLFVTHGGIGDPERYVLSASQARGELGRLAGTAPEAGVLVLGHTHLPLAVGEHSGALAIRRGVVRLPDGERCVLNPGAVGQSRERGVQARAAVLDLETREVVFHAVPYDVAACRAALVAAGRPPTAYHLPPRPVRDRMRRAGRVPRRIGARVLRPLRRGS